MLNEYLIWLGSWQLLFYLTSPLLGLWLRCLPFTCMTYDDLNNLKGHLVLRPTR